MSIGMILLLVLALLILFGVLQRVLDRMALTDRQALIGVAAIFIGGWLPDLTFGMVTVNIGGALIPLILCVYLFFHAGTAKERVRSLVASALTAAAIYIIGLYFPADPVTMPFDPMILYGVAGGAIAWLLGRSRRSAFIAGILGVVLADVISGVMLWSQGVNQALRLGGAGALDAVVLSGVIAVLLCELFGEIMERITTGRADAPHEDGAIEGGQRA
ncbi:MAG: DUF1614 domain-containing protein [Clostridia bacterium]|nr:DUF1614 domain-containing protein [Clostridia bacterium]